MTDIATSTQNRRGILRRLLALAVLPFAGRAGAQERAPAVIEITKFSFVPAEFSIRAGDSVVFVNRDLVPHTATADDGAFDTGTLRQDERKEIIFEAAGAFSYVCRFHRHMTGIVRVT
jgi:plastocyanin